MCTHYQCSVFYLETQNKKSPYFLGEFFVLIFWCKQSFMSEKRGKKTRRCLLCQRFQQQLLPNN